jgi:hypothetical protein
MKRLAALSEKRKCVPVRTMSTIVAVMAYSPKIKRIIPNARGGKKRAVTKVALGSKGVSTPKKG